jgi:molecular chaperone DnaJ
MDLYSLLGLARTASADDIARAYRRLVRRYHPGVNPGDRLAEQMYRQIQEAYQVLADAERRREYDRGVHAAPRSPATDAPSVAFDGFDFSAPAEGAGAATFSELFADVFRDAARQATASPQGADIELAVTVPFLDAMRGADVPVSVTRHDRCLSCRGAGEVERRATVCPACQGSGTRRWARGHMVFTKPCDICGGSGRQASEPCRACRATGLLPRTEVVTLHLPAGIESGTRVAVPGHGHAGARGGPVGDLYVAVTVAPHRVFRRDGRDLHVTLPVAVHEAALGATVEVPTLEGRLRMRIPPGAQSGQRLRLRDQGVPGTDRRRGSGDLVVELQIMLPTELDEASRELLREFGRRQTIDLRQPLFQER